MNKYAIQFITPLFSCGAYNDLAEIRPPSIRGQLRWWFRILGGSYPDEKAVFGSVHGGAVASKIVVRVTDEPAPHNPPVWLPTLPHKPGGPDPKNAPNAPRCALRPGTRFTLIIGERLGGLREPHRQLVERTIRSWLLAGSLGLRTTRGGGSLFWDGSPAEPEAFKRRFAELLDVAPLQFDLLEHSYHDAEEARKVITETISHEAFEDLSYPLGAVAQRRDDPAPSRKTSPLRLTVRRFNEGFRILAIWDSREKVTHNTRSHLREAIDRMAKGTTRSRPVQIGKLLQRSTLGMK